MYLAITIFSRLGKAKETTHDNYQEWVLHYILTHFTPGIITGLDMPCGKTAHTYTHSLLMHLVLSPHLCPYQCINTPSHKYTCIYIPVHYFLIRGHNHVIWQQPHYIYMDAECLQTVLPCTMHAIWMYSRDYQEMNSQVISHSLGASAHRYGYINTYMYTYMYIHHHMLSYLPAIEPTRLGLRCSATIHHAGVHVHPPTEVIIMRGKGAVFLIGCDSVITVKVKGHACVSCDPHPWLRGIYTCTMRIRCTQFLHHVTSLHWRTRGQRLHKLHGKLSSQWYAVLYAYLMCQSCRADSYKEINGLLGIPHPAF